jgi:hypothetical protein
MSPLDPLAPDQRAVVALVLQQGRSYDDIAALLGIPVGAVRARAHAGLAALAPDNGLPIEITGPIADFLLAQQPAGDAAATRGLLAESAPARAWATGVADRLADVAPAPLPEIPDGAAPEPAAAPEPLAAPEPAAAPASAAASAPPAEVEAPAHAAPSAPDEPAAPRPRPVRESAPPEGDAPPPASSKLGGILLIAGVVAVVAVVLFLVLRGGDDPSGETPATASATATPTATAEPQVTDQIELRSPNGGKGKATMTVYLQGEQLLFALQGEQLPAGSYGVWLTGPGDKAQVLGYVTVQGDGALAIGGPQDKDLDAFPQWYATYENVVLSKERAEGAERPTKPVLTGKLPAGR